MADIQEVKGLVSVHEENTLRHDLKAEFRLWKATFRHYGRQRHFYFCKWWDVSIPLTVFRILATCFAISILTATLVFKLRTSVIPLCAFTIWSYFMLTCYFFTASIVSIVHSIKDRQSGTHSVENAQPNNPAFTSNERLEIEGVSSLTSHPGTLPWYMQLQWTLYNIILPNALLVTLIYWSVLYPQAKYTTDFLDVSLHALNTVLIITEQYLGSIPTRLLHVYQPIIYALIYMIFSTILWAKTGIVIYPYVLDWTHPGITAGSLCGIILFFFVTQLVLFLIYRVTQRFCTLVRH